MKKQIALLLSATLALSSFGFSAWADEIEISEPVLGGIEIVPPSIDVAEDVEIITPDFVVDGEVIEIPEEDFEIEESEEVETEDDFSDIDLPEVGASSMLSGSGSEVIMGEEIQNAPVDDININVGFDGSYTGLTGNSRIGTPTYEQDAVLGSKVLKMDRLIKSESSYAGFYKEFSAAKKGRIYASVKIKVDDTATTHVAPIGFYPASQVSGLFPLAQTVYIFEGKFRIPNVTAGSQGTASTEIGPALSDQWYQIDIYANVDGNTSTTDTLDYEIYTLGANDAKVLVYSGENINFGNNIFGGSKDFQANAGIPTITYGMISKNGWSPSLDGSAVKCIWLDDAICKYVPAEASSEVKNQTINPGVSQIVVNFTQYMTPSTFQNITVTKANGDPVTDVDGAPVTVTVAPVNARKAKIMFSEVIAGNEQYKIIVPASVKTQTQENCIATTIPFATSEYVYEVPFDPSLSFERKFDDNSTSGLSHIYFANSIVTDADQTRGKVWEVRRSGAPDKPYTSYLSSTYYTLPSAQTGPLFMSIKFKLPENHTKWDFSPISFIANKQSYYSSASFLRVKDGKFLENDCVTSPADAVANVWYQFDMTLFVDGDSTTNDTYSYTLKRLDGGVLVDGKSEITKENVVFGKHEYGGKGYNEQVSVDRVHFAQIATYGKGYAGDDATVNVSENYYLDDIVVKKFLAPAITATIADGATNVPINKEIVLTFDQKVDASAFSKIMLKQGDNVLDVTPSVTSGFVKSVTLDTKDFDYNREYVLTISGIKNQGGIQALTKTIRFSTELKPSNVGVDSATVTKLTNGNTITIGATLQNKAMPSKTQASIITTLVGMTSGRVYDIAYKTYAMETQTVSTSLELTKPNNLSETVKVVVYVFDTINNMDLATNPIDK